MGSDIVLSEKLGNIAHVNMGQSPESEYYNSEGKGIPLIQGNADIKNRKSIQRIWTTKLTKQCEKGDIILTVRAPVGFVGIANFNSCLGRGVCSIKQKKIDGNYLYYLLIYMEHSWNLFEQGSTFAAVGSHEIINFPLSIINSLAEQTRIAEILSTADEAISETEALIAKYQRIKTGLMQDLLTKGIDENGNIRNKKTHKFVVKNGIEVPEEWEVDTIDKFAKIITGSSNTQDKDESAIYPFFVRSQIIEKSNRYLFDGEGVLTSGDGVGVGKIYHYINGKFDFHQRVYLIHSFQKNYISGEFFFYYFKEHFYNEVSKYSAKTTVDSLRLNMIAEMKVPIPKYSEQNKILQTIKNQDTLIDIEKNKLTKLQKLKTGLMQDLLSGRVRVEG